MFNVLEDKCDDNLTVMSKTDKNKNESRLTQKMKHPMPNKVHGVYTTPQE